MHAPANSRRSLAEIARLDIWARRKQDDRSLLHHACYCDRNGVVRFLLGDTYRDSRSVNTIDSEYMTPLHIVCSRGNEVATRLLLRYGANVNARSRFGYTPLHHAAARDHLRTVDPLRGLPVGTSLTKREREGRPQQRARIFENDKGNKAGLYINAPVFQKIVPPCGI